MNEKSIKKTKLEERILTELNSYLRTNISEKKMQFVSFTKVELNNDLSLAHVFWDSFDASLKSEIEETLGDLRGKLRGHLSQVIRIRHTPNLKITYDSQYESEREIEDILAKENEKGKTF